MPESLPKKLQAEALLKMRLVQVFSCEFCEISKSTFFYSVSPDGCLLEISTAYLTCQGYTRVLLL